MLDACAATFDPVRLEFEPACMEQAPDCRRLAGQGGLPGAEQNIKRSAAAIEFGWICMADSGKKVSEQQKKLYA